MYRVYWDSFLLHDLIVPEEEGYYLKSPTLTEEINKVAEFTFDIYPTHPMFDRIEKLVPNIIITKNNRIIFKGRIIKEKQNMDNSKQVTCESVLAFLLDSVQRPFEFQGTPAELFTQFIAKHNEQVEEYKRFKIGKTTGSKLDNNEYINRSSESYLNTWEAIETRLLNIGGYLLVRYEDDGNYIDWVDDFVEDDLKVASAQTIEFGENLIDITVENDGADIYTVVIPLGAETEHEDGTKTRLTIASINDGKDYLVNEDALNKYGWIVAPIEETTWDDVTVVDNLKRKGQELLNTEGIFFKSTLELSAIDLNVVDGSIDSFEMYEYIKAQSTPHNISKLYLLTKKQTPLANPENMRITLGENKSTLTGMQLGETQNIKDGIHTIIKDYQINIPQMKEDIKDLQETLSVESTKIMYYLSDSSQELTGGSWVETPPKWVDGKYYWQKNVTTFSDGSVSETTPICVTGGKGATGENGQDGKDGKDGENGQDGKNGSDGKSAYQIWLEQGNTGTEQDYLNSLKGKDGQDGKDGTNGTNGIDGKDGANGKDGEDGKDGTDGKGISSITNYYLATTLSSGVTTSTSGWTDTIQTITSTKKYLWNYEVIKYTDNSSVSTQPCIIGTYGVDGKDGEDGKDGINGTNGKDGTNGTNGKDGADGVGISSITEHYAISSSNSQAPSSWSTTVPTMTSTNKYLWNYETINYTNGTSKETSKRVIGVYGDTGKNGTNGTNGKDGQDGADGIGIESITTEFYLSTSKTEQTGGSWETTMPEWSKGMYLWTRNKIVYSDSTIEYTEPVCDSSWEAVNDLEEQVNNSIADVREDFTSSINQTSSEIRSEVASSYVSTTAMEQYQRDVSTLFTQQNDSFQMTFTDIIQRITNIDGTVNSNYNELVKYIRFQDGKIILGEVNNPLILTLDNDRLSFTQNGVEVAYFNNYQLYVNDGVFINSLKIGRWAFIPRKNGNLSFKLV